MKALLKVPDVEYRWRPHIEETPEQEVEKGISDEVFDEIVGIENISIEPEASRSATGAMHDEEVKPQDEKIESSTHYKRGIVGKEQTKKIEHSPVINEEEVTAQDEKIEHSPVINEEEVKAQDEKIEHSPIINEEEVQDEKS